MNVFYDCRWSSSFSSKFIDDFLSVQKQVLGHSLSEELFIKKYVNNIYGESVVIVVYIDGVPSAVDALWRNDVYGNIAFQSADTAVLNNCRGLGVFREMVRRKISLVDKDNAYIYGFPNSNSFPGFIKFGWILIDQFYPKLMVSMNDFLSLHKNEIIDMQYLEWWFSKRDNYYYVRYFNHYLLVHKQSNFFLFSVVGEIEKEAIYLFPHRRFPFFLFYKSKSKSFYNKKRIPARIISLNGNSHCPCWKLDVI